MDNETAARIKHLELQVDVLSLALKTFIEATSKEAEVRDALHREAMRSGVDPHAVLAWSSRWIKVPRSFWEGDPFKAD